MYTPPFVIDDEEAWTIVRKVQEGTTSMLEEAKLRGHNHGTLLHACKRVLGEEAYAAIVAKTREQSHKLTKKQALEAFESLKVSKKLRVEAKRLGCSCPTLRRALLYHCGKEAYDSLNVFRFTVRNNDVLAIVERLSAGSSVMAEARRLGCRHTTLRKALREALGATAYAELMSTRRVVFVPARRLTQEQATEVLDRLRAGSTLAQEAERIGYHVAGLRTAIYRLFGKDVLLSIPKIRYIRLKIAPLHAAWNVHAGGPSMRRRRKRNVTV